MQSLLVPTFELIVGCMFSGKTEELIRLLRRYTYAQRKVALFKSHRDNRCASDRTETHNGESFKAIEIGEDVWDIVAYVEKHQIDVIGIDEVQFFNPEIIEVIKHLMFKMHKTVIAAGLDRDFRGKPFGHMPQLMPLANPIHSQHAYCAVCGNPAVHSQRLVASQDLVEVGGKDTYEPRCSICFDPPKEEED